ncbi:hypothetical protein HHK36_009332 [Tetracentron sinense]|uniref:Uncharacterized protein n=1 Tax=Tetracentron sinense TaxID=13715 RepID=A0A835DKX7_TETSI|nr:hypothetical protein HHK36_009332 [Tetracentron sinense]
MEFHMMKRKDLQALCKKHSIPANTTNMEMVDKLTSLLKGEEKFITGCEYFLKDSAEIAGANGSMVETKQSEKVSKLNKNVISVEMEFHKMKRKDLQALCIKHSIPANTTNMEMIDKLSSLLKGEEKSTTVGPSCLKDSGEIAGANGSKVVTKQSKKVTFCVEDEKIEIVDLEKDPDGKNSREMKRASRRRSMINPETEKLHPITKKVGTTESSEEIQENLVRTARSRAAKLTMVQSCPVEKKPSSGVNSKSSEVKNVNGTDKPPPVVNLSGDEVVRNSATEETRGPMRRSLKSKELSPGNLRAVSENWKEGAIGDARVVKKKSTQKRSRNRGNVKDREGTLPLDEVSEIVIAEIENENSLKVVKHPRRSKRNALKAGVSIPVSGEPGTSEMLRRNKRSRSHVLGEEDSAAESVTGTGVEVQEKCEETLQFEEPLRRASRNASKQGSFVLTNVNTGTEAVVQKERVEASQFKEEPPRRSRCFASKRKSIAPSNWKEETDEALGENKLKKQSGDTILEEEASVTRRAFQLEEPPRRSRRNASKRDSVAPTNGIDGTAEAVGKTKPHKQWREPILEEEASVTEHVSLIGEPQRRSKRKTSKLHFIAPTDEMMGTDAVAGKKESRKRSRVPMLEKEALVSKSVSPLEELPIDAGLFVPAVAGSTYKSVLSCIKEVPEEMNKKRKGKKPSRGNKQNRSEEVLPIISETNDVKEFIEGNLQETTVSKCVKLHPDSRNHEIQGSIREFVVVMEKEDMPMGDEKESLLEDNIQEGCKDDWTSRSGNNQGDFDYNEGAEPAEFIDDASEVVPDGITSLAEGFSPVHQSKDLKYEEGNELSTGQNKHPRDVGVTAHEVEDHKSSDCREILVEVVENNGLTVNEFALEDHFTESRESRGLNKNCEHDSEEFSERDMLECFDGHGISKAIDDRERGNNGKIEEASEILEIVSIAHEATTEIVADKATEVQFCEIRNSSLVTTPLTTSTAPGCPEYEAANKLSTGQHKYPRDGNVTDNEVEDHKASDCKEEKLVEIAKSNELTEAIIHDFVFEGYLTEFKESKGSTKNCEHNSEEVREMGVLECFDRFGISQSILEEREIRDAEKFEEADEILEIVTESHEVTAEIVAEKSEVQFTEISHSSFGTSPLPSSTAPECEVSGLNNDGESNGEHTFSIDRDEGEQDGNQSEAHFPVLINNSSNSNTDIIEGEDTSDYVTEIDAGTMQEGETFINNVGTEMSSKEKAEEDMREKKAEYEEAVKMGRALLTVVEEIDRDSCEGDLEVEAEVAPEAIGNHGIYGELDVKEENISGPPVLDEPICEDAEVTEKKASTEAVEGNFDSDDGKNVINKVGNLGTASPIDQEDLSGCAYHKEVAKVSGGTNAISDEAICGVAEDKQNQASIGMYTGDGKVVIKEGEKVGYLPQFAPKELAVYKVDEFTKVKVNAVVDQEHNCEADERTDEVKFDCEDGKDFADEEEFALISEQISLEKLADHENHEEKVAKMYCNADSIVDKLLIEYNGVTEAKVDGETLERNFGYDCKVVAKEEENAPSSPQVSPVELDDHYDHEMKVLAHEYSSADTILNEPSLINTGTEKKANAGTVERNFDCEDSLYAIKEENARTLLQVSSEGLSESVLDHEENFEEINGSGLAVIDDPICKYGVSSEHRAVEVAKEKAFPMGTEAPFDVKDSKDVLVEEENAGISPLFDTLKLGDCEDHQKVVISDVNESIDVVSDALVLEDCGDAEGEETLESMEDSFDYEESKDVSKEEDNAGISPHVTPEEIVDQGNQMKKEVSEVNGGVPDVSDEHIFENGIVAEDKASVATMEGNTGFEDSKDAGAKGVEKAWGSTQKCDNWEVYKGESRGGYTEAENFALASHFNPEMGSSVSSVNVSVHRGDVESKCDLAAYKISSCKINFSGDSAGEEDESLLHVKKSGREIAETKEISKVVSENELTDSNVNADRFFVFIDSHEDRGNVLKKKFLASFEDVEVTEEKSDKATMAEYSDHEDSMDVVNKEEITGSLSDVTCDPKKVELAESINGSADVDLDQQICQDGSIAEEKEVLPTKEAIFYFEDGKDVDKDRKESEMDGSVDAVLDENISENDKVEVKRAIHLTMKVNLGSDDSKYVAEDELLRTLPQICHKEVEAEEYCSSNFSAQPVCEDGEVAAVKVNGGTIEGNFDCVNDKDFSKEGQSTRIVLQVSPKQFGVHQAVGVIESKFHYDHYKEDVAKVEDNVGTLLQDAKEQHDSHEDNLVEDVANTNASDCVVLGEPGHEDKISEEQADGTTMEENFDSKKSKIVAEEVEALEIENFAKAHSLTPETGANCSAVSPLNLTFQGIGDSKFNFTTYELSSWEINLFSGENVLEENVESDVGAMESNFDYEDCKDIAKVNDAVLEEPILEDGEEVAEMNDSDLAISNELIVEDSDKVAEVNGSISTVLDEPIFGDGEVSKEHTDVATKEENFDFSTSKNVAKEFDNSNDIAKVQTISEISSLKPEMGDGISEFNLAAYELNSWEINLFSGDNAGEEDECLVQSEKSGEIVEANELSEAVLEPEFKNETIDQSVPSLVQAKEREASSSLPIRSGVGVSVLVYSYSPAHLPVGRPCGGNKRFSWDTQSLVNALVSDEVSPQHSQ